MTNTSKTVEDVAAELRRSYAAGPIEAARATSKLLADKVEMLHEPPSHADGWYARGPLERHRVGMVEALVRAVPDWREAADISVRGDSLVVNMIWSGTLPDGSRFTANVPSELTVKSGRIIRTLAKVDGTSMAPLLPLLQSVGWDMAADAADLAAAVESAPA